MSVLRWVADENLTERLVLAWLRRVGDLDIVRVRDAGRTGCDDAELLAWAADQGRIVVTHDARTMPAAAYARVGTGQTMPGLFIVPADAAPQAVLEDLVLISEVSVPDDWRDRVVFLPLDD